MKYRKLSPSGDYVFGQGPGEFFENTPEGVGQAVLTRLRLHSGELFWATQDGVPYETRILGLGSKDSRDQIMMNQIVSTTGVQSLDSFESTYTPQREYNFTAVITTIYGRTTVSG